MTRLGDARVCRDAACLLGMPGLVIRDGRFRLMVRKVASEGMAVEPQWKEVAVVGVE